MGRYVDQEQDDQPAEEILAPPPITPQLNLQQQQPIAHEQEQQSAEFAANPIMTFPQIPVPSQTAPIAGSSSNRPFQGVKPF